MFRTKTVKDLQTKIIKLEEAQEDELRSLRHWHEVRETKHWNDLDKTQRELDRCKERNTFLRSKIETAHKLEAQEVDLKQREAVYEAKNKRFAQMASEIADFDKKLGKVRDEGYKTGYADGSADGLRKGTEMTADDRRMMAQVAALAAASHSSDASKEIGKAVGDAISGGLKTLDSGKSK